MTGFGKALQETEDYQVDIEIKSVNHRFLDIQVRCPRELNFLENALRQSIKEHISRGRIEIYVTVRSMQNKSKQAVIQWPLVDSLIEQLESGLMDRYGQTKLNIESIMERLIANPDFVTIQEQTLDEDKLSLLVQETLVEAVEALDASRQKEGTALQTVISENKDAFAQSVKNLQAFVAIYEAEYQERFQQKLENYLSEQVDQERLLTELAILLEKGDIHEELDRLLIHLNNMEELLYSVQPVGRQLDFLIQEMNREVNTIGSKSTAMEIKEQVVQLKTILEKIREQIQNIE